MHQRGRKVQILPRASRDSGIDKVREMLGTCWFDADKCADGLNRLRYYRYGETATVNPQTGDRSLTREPIHDDNSHGADALRSFAMGYTTGTASTLSAAVFAVRLNCDILNPNGTRNPKEAQNDSGPDAGGSES